MPHPKHAHAEHDVIALIRERWSPRSFDPAKPVSREDVLRLFEAARWAPSSSNEQPWRFVVCERTEAEQLRTSNFELRTEECADDRLRSLDPANPAAPSRYLQLFMSLTERNRSWAAAAPVLVLVAAKRISDQFGVDNRHALYDTGQAMGLLTVQATAMGVSVRQIEGFDKAQARAAVRVPDDFELVVVCAIGYAGDPDGLPIEKHRAAERAPRTRRALSDVVFAGEWGAEY